MFLSAVFSQVFSDDPLEVVHTLPYSPSAMKESSSKKALPPVSLWMCKFLQHC